MAKKDSFEKTTPSDEKSGLDRRLCVAPMLDWTDRFFRYFLRLITRRTLLYTEMVTTWALLRGDTARLLEFDPLEHPVALQLGGNDPADLARCALLAQHWGYDEVNLNLGCPSDRVQNGRFGACLMGEPERVADCIRAMKEAVTVPVTVKTRIGVDHNDSYRSLSKFVATLAAAGADSFIIHARKAWLQGLSPKENRTVPPLRYDIPVCLKRDLPDLEIILNGGVTSLTQAAALLPNVDGMMIGRAAYHDPWLLANADSRFFGVADPARDRQQVIADLLPFVEHQLHQGVPLARITRHILGLFHGAPGGRAWRRHLSERSHRPGTGVEIIQEAASRVSPTLRHTS